MTQIDDQTPLTAQQLQARIAANWQELQTFLAGLSHEQLTGPSDEAGWTIKDHAIHIALWEKSILGLLNSESRWGSIDIDEAVWQQGFETVNQVLYQRYHDLPLDDVYATLAANHAALVARIAQLSDQDLLRPQREFQAGSTNDEPIIGWIIGDTFDHYAEHLPWMQAILNA
ncbi:ClbS/DfsB family four-helix bundle protein [Herpetosiphon llansteffanensis]